MLRFRLDAQIRLSNTLDKVTEVTANIESALQTIRDNLDSAEQDVNAFRLRADDKYLSASFEESIVALAKNVDMLTGAVASLQTETNRGTAPSIDIVQSKSTLDAVIARSASQQTDPITTVYFQFAGVTRELAEEISKNLSLGRFTIPGEERIGTPANKSEVRYFYPEDKEKATVFAEAANNVLGSMQLQENVSARFLQIAKGAPRRGVLELWLEPKPAQN